MKEPRLILLILLIIYSSVVKAQPSSEGSIQGGVIDELRNPLSFASILLRNSSDNTIYKTGLTNDLGVFQFKQLQKGNYVIEFKMMGYETLVKKDVIIDGIVKEIKLDIVQLVQASKMISEVVVQAQVPLIERRADKIIVNLNNEITGSSIMDVMDRMPGVMVTRPQDIISLNGKAVIIYVDGRPLSLRGDALASFLKGMSSANIQKVELIANPSAKYDAAGSGGIINIVKKRENKEGLVGNTYGGYQQGRYGRNNAGITLNYKNKLYNFFSNTSYAYQKYFIDSESFYNYFTGNNSPLGKSVFATSSIRNNQTITPSIGADIYLSKQATLSFSSLLTFTDFNRYGKTMNEQLNNQGLRVSRSDLGNDLSTYSTSNISNIHLVRRLDTLGKELIFDVDYSSFRNNSDFTNADKLYNALGNFISDRNSLTGQNSKLSMYAIKADFVNPLNKSTNLEAGGKSSFVRSKNDNLFYNRVNNNEILDNTKTDYFNYSENINALYINFNKKYNRLSVQMGLRGEHTLGKGRQLQTNMEFTNQYIKIFPQLAIDYKLNAKHGLTLNFNKRINRPSYENLNPLVRFINSTNYVQGNPNLLAGTSNNSSIRYSYNNELFLTLSYDVSLKEQITITSQSVGSTFTSMPGNDKRSNYYSALASYSKPLKKWWTINGTFHGWQQQYKSIVNGYELSSNGIPAMAVSTYQNFTLNDELSLGVGYVYASKYQFRNRMTEANQYGTLGARLKIFGTRGTLNLSVTDIFNTYNAAYSENSILVKQGWDNSFETQILHTGFTFNFGKGRIKSINKGTATEEERKRTNVKEN